MRHFLNRLRDEDRGVLTFEWILLITVIIIGIVGGLSAVRDAVITELGDVAGAVVAVDQSWSIQPSPCDRCGSNFGSYVDTPTNVVTERPAEPPISQ